MESFLVSLLSFGQVFKKIRGAPSIVMRPLSIKLALGALFGFPT